jgi:hypothetical protein
MKKFFCTLAAIAVFASSALADEGMWMLPLLQKMNAKQMKELGCQLSPKQIYNINNSLKDAIVQFGGGCTGEIISKEGLLVTNHHCGYGSIQKLSSVEHDYLKDGFWAMNRAEELPCEGLTVTFLKYMEDVTGDLEKAEKKAAKEFEGQENAEELIGKAVAAKAEELKKAAEKKNPNCRVYIENFYNENVQYLIVYKIYKDIRFVGAPPSSIGKFGADTDNWMWPRHTGDFSMFRVYADKNGEPAEYSADNVPLKTKNHLKISTAGVNEGDFTMIMGYPGRTTRFQTSPELRNQIALNDVRIAARTVRQDVMLEDMLADPKVKIQYASKYSGSTNGWKKWQGMKLAFDKLDIIGRAEQEEADFQKWADAKADRKAKYGNAITALAEAAAVGQEENIIYTYINESLARIELVNAAANVVANLTAAGKNGLEGDAAWKAACGKMQDFYKDYSESTDRKVAKALIRFYRDNVDSKWYPEIENFATMDVDAYVDAMFDASVFSSPEKLAAANAEALAGDPATAFLASLRGSLAKVIPAVMAGNEAAAAARKTYTAGLLEWKKGEPSYPDANFTMRCTYGTVKGYSPKDAVIYRHYTTLDGVMEKEDPDNWEFVVPAKLKELWKAKDFGKYGTEDGKMVTCFLSNNDITGGNSGSPIMNAKGELIGLAFDGNWESMSSDVMFEPDLQRCINVDIRYVLFIVDKFGGAKWLIDEMDIVR